MHPFAQAALPIYQRAFADLDAALDGLPDAAADWVPTPSGTNSLTVLVRHGISATIYITSSAAGSPPDRVTYIQEDRPAAFAARGGTVASLRAEAAAASGRLATILAGTTDASLAAAAPWNWPDGTTPNGAEILVHGAGHLREHVGQAQLMRDLWFARPGAGA